MERDSWRGSKIQKERVMTHVISIEAKAPSSAPVSGTLREFVSPAREVFQRYLKEGYSPDRIKLIDSEPSTGEGRYHVRLVREE